MNINFSKLTKAGIILSVFGGANLIWLLGILFGLLLLIWVLIGKIFKECGFDLVVIRPD
jgi:uncharacterized membrane protein